MVRYNLKMFVWIIVPLSLVVFFIFYFLADVNARSSIKELWGFVGKTVASVFFISLAFEKWIWKWNFLHPWLVQIPNLFGKWKGTIHYYWNNQWKDKPTEVEIKQSFLYVQVNIKTDESWSRAICSSFDIDIQRGIKRLIYSYYNISNASVRDRSPIHYGTACLDIDEDNNKMEGNYWTDRKTQGELIFDRRV